jgi:predicted TIM-barrel fold metal-dependent hydrolase
MIVDTHVHYNDLPAGHAKAGSVAMAHLSVDELLEHASEAGIDKIVQVTPFAAGYDNGYSLRAAEEHSARVVGVLGRVDPLGDDLEDRVAEFFSHKAALGLRFVLFNSWSEDWLRDGKLDPILRLAERNHFPIELFMPYVSPDLQRAARRFPGVRFIADHMQVRHVRGIGPRDTFRYWDETISLACEPNVWLKVSHFPEAAMAEGYPFPTALSRFQELCAEVGIERLIWGSNYPPVTRACSYRQSVDFIRHECSFLSAAEKDAVLGANFMAEFAVRKDRWYAQ